MQVTFGYDPQILEKADLTNKEAIEAKERANRILKDTFAANLVALDNTTALVNNFSRKKARMAMNKSFVNGVAARKPGSVVEVAGTKYIVNENGTWVKADSQ